jgi:hypothetical protein
MDLAVTMIDALVKRVFTSTDVTEISFNSVRVQSFFTEVAIVCNGKPTERRIAILVEKVAVKVIIGLLQVHHKLTKGPVEEAGILPAYLILQLDVSGMS